VLKKQFLFKSCGELYLTYAAGDYGDSVVGICTRIGRLLQDTLLRIKAYVFDLEGKQIRPLILPYGKLERTLSNHKQSFKYLQLVVCSEYVILQHTCYSKLAVYGPTKNFLKLTSGISLYKIKSQGLFLKLEYFQQLTDESLSSTKYITEMEGDSKIVPNTINLSNGRRKCQCDPADGNLYSIECKKGAFSIHITQFSRHQGYNKTNKIVLSAKRANGVSSKEGLKVYRSLASSWSRSRHSLLGPNNYAFAEFVIHGR
jgi:hypothetical protein